MDKNENGTPTDFSPEELIRRLKSKLNINTDQEISDTDNKSQDNQSDEAASVNSADEMFDDEFVADDENEAEDISVTVDDVSGEDVAENVNTLSDSADALEEVAEKAEASLDFLEEAESEDNSDIQATVESSAQASDDAIDCDIEEESVADSSDADETVEFSISSLFGDDGKNDDVVKEVRIDRNSASKNENEDDLDFLSFLTASGITANKPLDDTDIAEPDEGVSDAPVDGHTDSSEAVQPDELDSAVSKFSDEDELDTLDEITEEPLTETISENDEIVEKEGTDEADVASNESLDDNALPAESVYAEDESALAEVDNSDEQLDYSFDNEAQSDDTSDTGSKVLPDFNMLMALGIPVAEVEKIYGADAAEEYARLTEGTGALDSFSDDEDEYEYTSRSQNDEIEAHHRTEKKISFVKLFAGALLFLVALLYENLPAIGAQYSGWMDQSAFPVVHIMVDLQLVLFAAVLAWDEILYGIKALMHRSANFGTVLAAAVIINVLCDIALCFTRVAKYEVKLAGASVIFAVLMALGISALRLHAEIKAFSMISQKGSRSCVLTESPDDIRERNAFFDKISKEEASSAKVLSFGKTKFVSGFFGNQNYDRATVIDKILAPAAIVGAIIAFVVAYAVSKSVGIGLYSFNCAVAFLIPVSVFAAGTITYAKAASYAESMKAAIIGESAPYQLADSSVVAFEDRDAYPSYCVKLRNLKVYGNIAIVDVLRMTTTAFRQIGGPLSDVLESATSELNKDIPVEIVKGSEGGIEALYQGQRLIIGKADFLHSYGIIPYSDVDDREYLKTGDVSIMYVAYGDELAAKFYIQYTLDVDFEVLLRDLNRAGICVSIRTSDPNIDKRLLQAKLNLNKTSLRIVYRDPAEGRSEPTAETESAVVGTGTPSELIHTAMLCDRVVHVYRTNTIVKALSFVIGLALLVLFALISVNVNVFSGLLIIYQLFWMIPTLIVSKLFL